MSPFRYAVLQLAREKGSDRLGESDVIRRYVDAFERYVALQERAELRRSVRGLIRLQRKYSQEEVRVRPLRVVR